MRPSANDYVLNDLLSADDGHERDDQLDDGMDKPGEAYGDTGLTDFDPDSQGDNEDDDAARWLRQHKAA